MSFKNYLTEHDLKAYIAESEKLLWSGETDFNRQKHEAERIVMHDLSERGFKPSGLMPELLLRKSGSLIPGSHTAEAVSADGITRLRFITEVKQIEGTSYKTVILEGSRNMDEWEKLHTFTIEGTGVYNGLIEKQCRFYRVTTLNTEGSIDHHSYLAETTYDRLIIYKWLELILLDRYTEENDQYHLKMKYFKNGYDTLWNTISIWSDDNADGRINRGELNKTSSITMLK